MYSVMTNPLKNLLYITLRGKMEVNEIKDATREVISKAKLLTPGLNIISDIAEFIPVKEEGRIEMFNCMKTLGTMQLNKVVRIVPQTNFVAGAQFQRTSRQAGYEAIEVPTLAEAEAIFN